MEWTIRYFLHQIRQWEARGNDATSRHLPGAAAYASRKVAMWEEMSKMAQTRFIEINPTHPRLIG
jgi:hypothetical protein